jgi:hypothetical protein
MIKGAKVNIANTGTTCNNHVIETTANLPCKALVHIRFCSCRNCTCDHCD